MSSLRKGMAALVLGFAGSAALAQTPAAVSFPGIGRTATPQEVAAWDIDVRPDFKGLPAGSGSVARGQEVWEGKCASCHGVFGESNEVFNPLVGGTSPEDVKTGRASTLKRADYPGRTTLMKLSSLSTLWDYINRAMPWAQPKSLTVEEVYAVTAYLLNLGGIVPEPFTLSDRNIRDVQQLLPNRNGMTTQHALWPGPELGGTDRPDVNGTACMKDCGVAPKVASMLPPFARNAHGNLAEQNRGVGAQRGVDTGAPASGGASTTAMAPTSPEVPANAPNSQVMGLVQKNNCMTCHAPDRRIVGPSWSEIAKKHEGKADYLAGKIKRGGSGVWGTIPMPPQPLADTETRQIANWLAAGAR
ncbi:MAG TPA: c-type cytochrome [Ramlibacter sp.]|nr:c-type cytochrome [Ramlibacter sp.]